MKIGRTYRVLDLVDLSSLAAESFVAGEDGLNAVRGDEELWSLILEREIAWSKLPGTLDVGDNIVVVVRKR